jgi:hypothetical protein
MTKVEFTQKYKKEVNVFFKRNSGFTIKQAMQKLKKDMKPYDRYISMSVGNVTLFYTDNINYANGSLNSNGKGWYINNKTVSRFGHEIKLQNTL